MKSSLRSVRAELKAALDASASPVLAPYHTYDRLPPTPELPCLVVRWPEYVEYGSNLAGASGVRMLVTAYRPSTDFDAAQDALDEIVSDAALRDALERHAPPSGLWHALHVERAGEYRSDNLGPASVLAVDFTVSLFA